MQTDPDYKDAWRACGAKLSPRVFDNPEEIDLRARLDDLLKSGWPMAALRSYASTWRTSRQPRVTPAVWRYGVYFASQDLVGTATRFLEEWKARQEELDQTTTQAEMVSALSV